MISLNNSKLYLITRCMNQFINRSKSNLLRTSIHLRDFVKMAENGGFCSKDSASLLQYLGDHGKINWGMNVHSTCIKTGLDLDVFVQNNLIRFYTISHHLTSARKLFDEISEPNLVTWTSMISAYVQDGQCEIGLYMFSVMCRSGLRPNDYSISVALKACRIKRDFIMGELLHCLIMKSGFKFYAFCSSSVIGIYVESGDLIKARTTFDEIPFCEKSEALWNVLLDGYSQTCDVEAFNLFHHMLSSNNKPNCFTYMILIKLCAKLLDLEFLKFLHCRTLREGISENMIVGSALVDTYGKLGSMGDACKVFENLEQADNVLWSSLLAGLHQNDEAQKGLKLFLEFLKENNVPDPFIFASVFGLCSKSEIERIGPQFHCSFIKYGFVLDSFLGSALIEMYGNFGFIDDAYKCFHEIVNKNEICYSTMINHLVLNSKSEMSLELFHMLKKRGLALTHSTYSNILRACANLHAFREGKSLHSYILRNVSDYNSTSCIENALLEMYIECGCIDEAKTVFETMKSRNEFSWTMIMCGFHESKRSKEALGLLHDMFLSPTNVKPTHFTFVPVLQSCAELEASDEGKQVHGYIIKVGYECFPFVGSALINMYAAFRHEIQTAYKVFSSMEHHDNVSWSTMVTAWAQNGCNKEALELFQEFQNKPIFSIDEYILPSCLSACAGLTLLEMGRQFHVCIIKNGFDFYLHVASSIMDMYSKCGSIKDSRDFFDQLGNQNLVCWTAMLSGYAHHGLGFEAVFLFNQMKNVGLKPDNVTFTAVLAACSHSGLLKEGWEYFESMEKDYGLEKTMSHYACMIDLLGRIEHLDEAEALINKAPFRAESKSLLWRTLLGACHTHGNIEKGNQIAKLLIELEPNEPSNYVLLSNIYAAASMWNDKVEVRNKMKDGLVSKTPGYSWVQMAG